MKEFHTIRYKIEDRSILTWRGFQMKQPQLEKEIRALQSDIYQLAKKTSSYSHGEILKLSQKLDQKIISYQKLFNHTK